VSRHLRLAAARTADSPTDGQSADDAGEGHSSILARSGEESSGHGVAQVWNGLFGHAMESDHRKPRRIQALHGSGAGKPTGLMVSKAIPSVRRF
jgi:hypothetical protein